MHILLIDENEVEAQQIKTLLSNTRDPVFEMQHAEQLITGLQILSAADIDAVLLACSPSTDATTDSALATLESLRAKTLRIPIIMVSSAYDENLALKALRSGAQGFIVKEELECPTLRRMIQHSIERQHAWFEDITAREQDELALQRYAERLRNIQDVDRAILGASSPEAVVLAALSRIRQLIPCRRALVMEINNTGEVKVLAGEANSDIELTLDALTQRDMLNTKAFQAGLAQGTENLAAVHKRSALQEALFKAGVSAYMLVPLIVQRELVGALYLGASHPYAFTADHVEIATEVASSLAIAIRQARLHQQTMQDALTKAVLLEEINHRVKNNLVAVQGLIQMELRSSATTSEIGKAALERIIGRIDGLSEVNRMLSAAEWAPLPLSDLATQIINLSLKTVSFDQRIQTEVDSSPVWVSPRQASSLALVIHELVTNTIKHVLPKRDDVRIAVHITVDQNTIILEFRDNGPGYPENVIVMQRYNVGLHLIRRLVRFNLRGTLSLTNDQGAVTIIEFMKGEKNDT